MSEFFSASQRHGSRRLHSWKFGRSRSCDEYGAFNRSDSLEPIQQLGRLVHGGTDTHPLLATFAAKGRTRRICVQYLRRRSEQGPPFSSEAPEAPTSISAPKLLYHQ